jgi:glycerol-3-phosphate dehydrogenase (NAD(P)+)
MNIPLAYAHLGVVGAGSWGTALAVLANRAGTRTSLFTRNEHVAQSISDTRMNATYLADVFMDPSIEVTLDMQGLSHCDAVLVVVPAQSLRTVMIMISDLISAKTPIIIATKGIERGSLLLMSEVVQSIMPSNMLAILSGPNFAKEAAMALPTASVLATNHPEISAPVSYLLNSKYFRVYQNSDPIGTQIGGALKNVLAIACGIVQGAGLGENARAAIITRGLSEIVRLSHAKGGQEETLLGLAGVGDITLSCSSAKSRNYALGVAIGVAGDGADALDGQSVLQEGVATAESAYHLAQKLGVNMPIISGVHAVLSGEKPLQRVIEGLLENAPTAE